MSKPTHIGPLRLAREILFLLLLLGGTCVQAAYLPLCQSVLWRLSFSVLDGEPVLWKSRYLKDGPLTHRYPPLEAKARVREIVDLIYEDNSAIGKEFDEWFRSKMAAPDWIDDYFKSYEAFYYSPLYQLVVQYMNEALPREGRILDVGSGTGGMGFFMADAAKGRRVTFVDQERGVALAEDRAKELFGADSNRFDVVPQYLGPKSNLKVEGQYDAAILNHVLYIIGNRSKMGALRTIRDNLRPGGRLLVNEPIKEQAEKGHREWFTRVLETAAQNGAPHSEFDYGFITAVASGRATKDLRGGAPPTVHYLTEQEHRDLFAGAGFRVLEVKKTYGGFSRFWVLEPVEGFNGGPFLPNPGESSPDLQPSQP